LEQKRQRPTYPGRAETNTHAPLLKLNSLSLYAPNNEVNIDNHEWVYLILQQEYLFEMICKCECFAQILGAQERSLDGARGIFIDF